MTRSRIPLIVAFASASVLILPSCSGDALLWGAEGARVVQTTDRLISDLSSDGQTDLVCASTELDLGSPSDWAGSAAGEPERFQASYWEEQADLEPHWNINLERGAAEATSAGAFPSYVFFRDQGNDLCVVDVVWATS